MVLFIIAMSQEFASVFLYTFFSLRAAADSEMYFTIRVLAIPVVKCLFMPTAEIALTADLVRSQARARVPFCRLYPSRTFNLAFYDC